MPRQTFSGDQRHALTAEIARFLQRDRVVPTISCDGPYWEEYRWLGIARPPQGMEFDIGYADAIRDGVRATIAKAAGGAALWLSLCMTGLSLH